MRWTFLYVRFCTGTELVSVYFQVSSTCFKFYRSDELLSHNISFAKLQLHLKPDSVIHSCRVSRVPCTSMSSQSESVNFFNITFTRRRSVNYVTLPVPWFLIFLKRLWQMLAVVGSRVKHCLVCDEVCNCLSMLMLSKCCASSKNTLLPCGFLLLSGSPPVDGSPPSSLPPQPASGSGSPMAHSISGTGGAEISKSCLHDSVLVEYKRMRKTAVFALTCFCDIQLRRCIANL